MTLRDTGAAPGVDGPPVRSDPGGLAALVTTALDGLALLDAEGRFLQVNPAACRVLGAAAEDLVGRDSVFDPGTSDRRTVGWCRPGSQRERELEYRVNPVAGEGSAAFAVAFRDITEARLQQRRCTAFAGAAAHVAEAGSLRETLDAICAEVVDTAELAAAQILLLDEESERLRLHGAAPAEAWPEDFALTIERACRRGARLSSLEALQTGRPVVHPNRKTALLADPAWEPLHEQIRGFEWDAFVSAPLRVRDTPVGALNAYCRPDHDPDEGEVAFLASMADHAAVAVENARLLAESRGKAALEERHRLARDLHDSACQQLFSLALHVRAAQLTLPRQGPENETVRRSLQTLDQLAHATLDDVRGLLFELHPPVLHERCAGAGGTVMPGAAPRIRVFVVDDHAVVRLGLRTFLDAVSDVELIGEATGGHAALERLDRLAELGKLPHVVLMDLVMRDPDGVATTEMILERHPNVAVVVMTGFGEVHRVQAALEAGATGHVLKDADVDEIVHAIRAAYRREVHLDDTVTRTLTQALAGTRRGADALTRRERDVLVLVAQGRSNREIARILSIGERTVQTHLSNVLGKLELSSRTQAALWAVREGLVGL